MDSDDCSKALASAFPNRRFAPPQPILGGWSFWTFRVGDLIVRFPVTDGDARGLEREFRLLPELGPRLPVAVPHYELTGEWGDRPFGAYPALPGSGLDEQRGRLSARSGLYADLAHALRALHSFPLERAAILLGTDRPDDAPFWEAVHRDALPLLGREVRDVAEKLISRHARAGGEAREALVHNDLGLVHVFSAGPRITGIIDWTDACIGDPAKDFVGVLAIAGWATVRRMLRDYGMANAGFEERLGFYTWVAPLHDILYGVATNQREYVTAGRDGVEIRMRLAGVLR
jgi:aminoglycoside 2''-phosphotransferase